MVRPVEAAPGSMGEGDLLDMFEAEDASAEALSLGGCGIWDVASWQVLWSTRRLILSLLALRKCRAISKMLTERAILKDALPHERVLSGAKNLLLKYALGSFVNEAVSGRNQNASVRSRGCSVAYLAQQGVKSEAEPFGWRSCRSSWQ